MNDDGQMLPVDPLDALLVAYLDGELPSQEAEQVERRLAQEPLVRQRLTALEKSVELLRLLPRSAPTQAFTQVTVTLAAEVAERELGLRQRRTRSQRIGWWLLGGGTAAAALVFGYLTTWSYLEAPNAQLRRDLPVLQHLDEYRTADSLEFIQRLEQAGLFTEEVDDAL